MKVAPDAVRALFQLEQYVRQGALERGELRPVDPGGPAIAIFAIYEGLCRCPCSWPGSSKRAQMGTPIPRAMRTTLDARG